MISSEVQRTLVKSAPELWAELSDPAALARHLGELGEIRITRIDPEQKVEWEACDNDISGTVVIKPSGWGTKVMLTVTRDTADAETPIAPQADHEPQASAATALDLEAEPEPSAEDMAAAEPTARPEPEPVATAEPQASPEPDPVAETEPEPLAQSLPETAEPVDAPDHSQAREPIPLSNDAELELLPAAEPRRGFFARLFGRFRMEESEQREPPHGATLEDSSVERQSDVDGHAEPPHELASAEPARELPDAHAAWSTWAEPTESAPPVEPDNPEPAAIDEPHVEPAHDADAFDAHVQTHAAAANAHDADAFDAPEQTQAAESHAHADLSDSPSSEPTVISAEIGAEEEVAAEEVTAVLTGVLDRLGAAHHRPFSRA